MTGNDSNIATIERARNGPANVHAGCFGPGRLEPRRPEAAPLRQVHTNLLLLPPAPPTAASISGFVCLAPLARRRQVAERGARSHFICQNELGGARGLLAADRPLHLAVGGAQVGAGVALGVALRPAAAREMNLGEGGARRPSDLLACLL